MSYLGCGSHGSIWCLPSLADTDTPLVITIETDIHLRNRGQNLLHTDPKRFGEVILKRSAHLFPPPVAVPACCSELLCWCEIFRWRFPTSGRGLCFLVPVVQHIYSSTSFGQTRFTFFYSVWECIYTHTHTDVLVVVTSDCVAKIFAFFW